MHVRICVKDAAPLCNNGHLAYVRVCSYANKRLSKAFTHASFLTYRQKKIVLSLFAMFLTPEFVVDCTFKIIFCFGNIQKKKG